MIAVSIAFVILGIALAAVCLVRMVENHLDTAIYGEFSLPNGYKVLKISAQHRVITDSGGDIVVGQDVDAIAWDDRFVLYRESVKDENYFEALDMETSAIELFRATVGTQEYLERAGLSNRYILYRELPIGGHRFVVLDTESGDLRAFPALVAAHEYLKNEGVEDRYVPYREFTINGYRFGVLDTKSGDIETFPTLDGAQQYLKNKGVTADLKLSSVKDHFPETMAGAPHSFDN